MHEKYHARTKSPENFHIQELKKGMVKCDHHITQPKVQAAFTGYAKVCAEMPNLELQFSDEKKATFTFLSKF